MTEEQAPELLEKPSWQSYNLTVDEMNSLMQTVLLGKERAVFGDNADRFMEDFRKESDGADKDGLIVDFSE